MTPSRRSDSGINVTHKDFGGRASWGYVDASLPVSRQDARAQSANRRLILAAQREDDTGHGTAVAGIAGGVHSGVYKNANLIAVKIT